MRKRSIIQMVLVGAVVGAALALVAWLIPWLPEPAAEQARGVDNAYWLVTIISVLIFALVAGVSVYAVWKFRAPPDDLEDGKPIHGHTGLEIVWTAIPTLLVTAIAVYSGVVLVQAERLPADGHRVVEVTSQQFAWSFTYPDEELTTTELALPVGDPVELVLTSRDVIHSFWVPEWRMKQDAVPGITTKLVVTPTRTGEFDVVCTELCGLGHALMRSKAVVLARADFDAWLDEQRQAREAAGGDQGATLYVNLGCGSCHALADAGTTAAVGPDLDNALEGADAEFVRESIVNPDAEIAEGFSAGVMPGTYGEQVSEQQLEALVEYLLTATQGG